MIPRPLSVIVAEIICQRLGFDSPQTYAVLAGFSGCVDLSFMAQARAAIEMRRL